MLRLSTQCQNHVYLLSYLKPSHLFWLADLNITKFLSLAVTHFHALQPPKLFNRNEAIEPQMVEFLTTA